jgi:hypothetical protein
MQTITPDTQIHILHNTSARNSGHGLLTIRQFNLLSAIIRSRQPQASFLGHQERQASLRTLQQAQQSPAAPQLGMQCAAIKHVPLHRHALTVACAPANQANVTLKGL